MKILKRYNDYMRDKYGEVLKRQGSVPSVSPTLISESQARAQAYERSPELGEWFDALVKHRESLMDQCNRLKQQLTAHTQVTLSQLGQANQSNSGLLSQQIAQKQYAQQAMAQAMAQANQNIQGATWASSSLHRGYATLASTGPWALTEMGIRALPEPKDDRVTQMVEDYKKDCEVK